MENIENRELTQEELGEIKEYIATLSKEELDAFILRTYGDDAIIRDMAQQDTPEGFAAFYELIFLRPLPKYVQEWADKIYEGRKEGKHTLIEAFRGSTKSTTAVAKLAFRIGQEPEKTNLIIGSGDDDATEVAEMVAGIIMHNPGWKRVFPHVVPDINPPSGLKAGHWGSANGYDVWDTGTDYAEWRRTRQQEGRAPTLKGVGYSSNYLPGPHPTGVLLIDDIHSEKNTSSERELRRVKTIYKGTILPMVEPETWHMVVGTPWTDSDLIAYVKSTGVYKHVFTAACEMEGNKLVNATWDKWDLERLERRRKEVGEVEFARMYLLDLEKTKGLILKKEWLKYWPHKEINGDWPVIIGVDYTSTEDPLRERGDYFALAIGRVIPGGRGIVIEDGLQEKLSQADAESQVVAWGSLYPTLVGIYVEAIIAGNEFYKHLLNNAEVRSAGLPILPVRFNKSKGFRFEKVLAPLSQRSRLYLSDAENAFVNAFKDEWLHWQGERLSKMYNDDTLDAVYAIIESDIGQSFVSPLVRKEAAITNPVFAPPKKANPIGEGFRRV